MTVTDGAIEAAGDAARRDELADRLQRNSFDGAALNDSKRRGTIEGDADSEGKRMASGHTGNDESIAVNVEKNDVFEQRASAVTSAEPDLAKIVAAWPTLPEQLKRAMLALIG